MAGTGTPLVTIFGGGGFIGTQVVQILARAGYRVRVAVRRPDLAQHVRPLGMVGQVHPVQANVRYPDSVARAMAGADAVVNLAATGLDRGRQRFAAVNVEGAAAVAQAASALGIPRFVHMSALGADKNSPSAFARSRAAGEAAVAAAYPGALILRPSVVFGPGDDFFNRFGALARLFPALPVIGGATRLQPVYVGDVAEALGKAVRGIGTAGVYELGGPQIVTVRAVIERVLAESGRKRLLVPLAPALARLIALPLELLPRPLLTRDQVTLLGIDNVVSEAAIEEGRTLAAFGVSPTAMDAVLPNYLWQYRKHGQFDRAAA